LVAVLLWENGKFEVVELFTIVVVDSSGHGSAGDGNGLSLVGTGDAAADHSVNTTGTSGKVPAVVEGAFGDEVGVTCRSLTTSGSAVGRVEKALIELAVLCSKEAVVFAEVDLISAGNVDKTVVVLALRVLVDQTTRHDTHLLAVKDRDVSESAGLDKVASVLREEDGNAGVAEEINELAVARLFESAIAAPIISYQHVVNLTEKLWRLTIHSHWDQRSRF
jgi:hypothetical protein